MASFYYKKSKIQQLRGFCAVVQEDCSIKKASEKLGLSNSAVSLQIKSLEEDVQTELFQRVGRSLKLTKNGRKLYEEIIPHLQSIDSAYKIFREEKKEKRTQNIYIAAQHIIISYMLPKHLKQYREKYNNVIINLYNIDKPDAYEKLKNEEIDFALFPHYMSDVKRYPELEFKDFFTAETFLIMHKDHKLASKKDEDITLEDMMTNNFFRIDSGDTTIPIIHESETSKRYEANIKFTNGNWEMANELVSQNLGIAGVSTPFLKKIDNDIIVAKNIDHILSKVKYSIAYKKGSIMPQHVSDFLKLIVV